MRSCVLWLLLYVGLGGCTPHGVRCDGRLQPINPSAQQEPVPAQPPAVVP